MDVINNFKRLGVACSPMNGIERLHLLHGIFHMDGREIGRYNVHIIACADCLFLFLDLGPVQVGDLPFHRLDGADLVHGLDMEADPPRNCFRAAARPFTTG